MIEFAPRSKNVMTYDEALLYCQFLDYGDHKDWRLPVEDEYSSNNMHCWYLNDTESGIWSVVPVRDV